MLSKIMCFLEHRFGRLLERVLGVFWEAKIIDFRNFLDVFSKSFLKRVSKRQKISPSRAKGQSGERKREGLRDLG